MTRQSDYEHYLTTIKPKFYRGIDLAKATSFSSFYKTKPVRWFSVLGYVDRRMVRSLLTNSLESHVDYFYRLLRSATEVRVSEDISTLKNLLVQVGNELDVRTYVFQHGFLGAKRGYLPLTAQKIVVWDRWQRAKLESWGLEAERIIVGGYESRYGRPNVLVCPHTLTNFGDEYEDELLRSLTLLQDVMRLNPQVDFTVKLHPGSLDRRFWTEWSRNHRNVKVAGKVDTFKLIKQHRLVVAHHTTVTMDAIKLGVRVVNLIDEVSRVTEEYSEIEHLGWFMKASTLDELNDIVRSV